MHKTVCGKTSGSFIHILVQHSSVGGDGYNLPRNELPAFLKGSFCSHFYTAAARNFHPDNRNTLDVVVCDYGSQLFRVITFVQLWTSNKHNLIFDKVVVEVSISISRAVCRDKQACSAEVRSVYRRQLNLYRPLGNWEGKDYDEAEPEELPEIL